MAKQAKAKSGKSRNDDRKNGKAPKQEDGRRVKKNPQDQIALVLLGKGLYTTVSKRADKDKLLSKKKRNKDSDS